MQDQFDKPRTAATAEHPDSAEWAAFLYNEIAPARRRELGAHLAACPCCSAQIKNWRATQSDLDTWAPSLPSRAAPQWLPLLKFAAAAAILLFLGFGWGRNTAPSAQRLARLEASLAQLSQSVSREQNLDLSNRVAAARTAAATETLRLLSEYSRFQDEQRSTDQQTLKTGLETLGSRLDKLRTELETVALNTETGFEQTHQNLARLVSYSAPIPTPTSILNSKPNK